MSTTTHPITAVPPALEVPGPVTRVPSLEELERLTRVPDQRVVFRGVDWAFYDRLVESIPESSNIQVGYDGKDLELMGKGRKHEKSKRLLGKIVDIIAEEYGIPFAGYAEATWKRPELARGLEADESFYFLTEKLDAAAEADARDSKDKADYPNPDLTIEVDISRPEIDRAGIYAALGVAEVWRVSGKNVIIERLTAEGTYESADVSGFLPVSAEDIRRWVMDRDTRDQMDWMRQLRAEIRTRVANRS
jgi:Uma2 family endonuclease